MTETWFQASCHCGAVAIEAAALPDKLNDCQCEHCQKRGALWAYYPLSEVRITGRTTIYLSGDRELEMHFCPGCGCTTHWLPVDRSYNRMGLNARTFGKAVAQSIPVRKGAAAG